MAIKVYEMRWHDDSLPASEIECVSFDENYAEQYKTSYNAAFYPMRKALDIQPYNWYSDVESILAKAAGIYLWEEHDELVGAVACYGNEIDDLFVCDKFKGQGCGKKLLIWAMNHIRNQGDGTILLHVAAWNEQAVKMYKDAGFVIVKTDL